MKPPELARLKDRLLALKAEILDEGDVALEPARRDEARVGGDEDEQPLAEMSQIIASKRNRARTDRLALVVAALARLEEHPEEFGLCTGCGEPIGKRLEALPFVEMCVECQQERDQDLKPGRRRHLTDFR